VDALRNVHAALVPGGLLVDTQPISAHPPVATDRSELGRLDMRDWIKTIRAVDHRVTETVAAGLYELAGERELVITSVFDDGPDCYDIASNWQGTRVPEALMDRLAAARGQVALEQHVRLRVFRRAAESR
jgi:hypothetical protein